MQQSYKRLSDTEREEISRGIEAERSYADIAR
ncbi:MAG: helix-turn-helix domain-containing protein, partial [Candidatus Yonathbacteria bacterium]|nr:helix-turn-helix domain-containing protein [Candidatus Yonathbacteria bacterium]